MREKKACEGSWSLVRAYMGSLRLKIVSANCEVVYLENQHAVIMIIFMPSSVVEMKSRLNHNQGHGYEHSPHLILNLLLFSTSDIVVLYSGEWNVAKLFLRCYQRKFEPMNAAVAFFFLADLSGRPGFHKGGQTFLYSEKRKTKKIISWPFNHVLNNGWFLLLLSSASF